jgi:hypothetical protein
MSISKLDLDQLKCNFKVIRCEIEMKESRKGTVTLKQQGEIFIAELSIVGGARLYVESGVDAKEVMEKILSRVKEEEAEGVLAIGFVGGWSFGES